MNVELYSKPSCSLCDEARATILEVQARIPFDFHEVDITRDPVLFEKYQHDIPVVFVDGIRFFKLKLDKEEFEQRLERSRAFALGTLDPQKTLSRTRPVQRATKVIFALTVFASIVAVFGVKAYQRLVLDPQRAVAGLELKAESRPAPAFELTTQDGKPLDLSAYRGKLLLLNFFATWCGPCREEVPSLMALARTTQGEKIEIVAIDVQEDWALVGRFFGKPPPFVLAMDATGKTASAYEAKPNLQFPETFVITPQGQIVAKIEGPRDWTDPAMLAYLRQLSRG